MPQTLNQTAEQIARDRIDNRLRAAGWDVQDKDALDFNSDLGIAVREYQTDIGPADYVLFADRQAVGVVEAILGPGGPRRTDPDQGVAREALTHSGNGFGAAETHFPFFASGAVRQCAGGKA